MLYKPENNTKLDLKKDSTEKTLKKKNPVKFVEFKGSKEEGLDENVVPEKMGATTKGDSVAS